MRNIALVPRGAAENKSTGKGQARRSLRRDGGRRRKEVPHPDREWCRVIHELARHLDACSCRADLRTLSALLPAQPQICSTQQQQRDSATYASRRTGQVRMSLLTGRYGHQPHGAGTR